MTKTGFVGIRKGNRSLMGEASLARGRHLLPLFAAAAVFVAFALVFVWTNYQSVQVGYEIAELHREQVRLTDLNRKYKVELANLTSLERLERLAEKQLGLVKPDTRQVRVVE